MHYDIFEFWIRRGKMKQESDMLRSYLKKAQDDITALLDEKRKLLDTVRTLQVIIAIWFSFFFLPLQLDQHSLFINICVEPNFPTESTRIER